MTERVIDPEREKYLQERLVANFKWLFPDLMQDAADGMQPSPQEIVEQHRHWLEAHRSDLFPNGTSPEDVLWTLLSARRGDASPHVKFETVLIWGELYGAGNFDALNLLRENRSV